MVDLGRAVDLPVQWLAYHIEGKSCPSQAISMDCENRDLIVIKVNLRTGELEHFSVIDQVEQMR